MRNARWLNTFQKISNPGIVDLQGGGGGGITYKTILSMVVFVYNSNSTVTYLINSSGELVKRVNDSVSRTALSSDDFDTFDTDATVNTTTYQDAV